VDEGGGDIRVQHPVNKPKYSEAKIFSIGNLYNWKTSFTFAQNFPQEYISCGVEKERYYG
jgi:hypothetical protein